MKKAVTSALRLGADGHPHRVRRTAGAARSRAASGTATGGAVHTLRAYIGYGQATAHTTYGTIGVKVWVFKGEVLRITPGEKKT